MTQRDYERWNEIEWRKRNVRTLHQLTNGTTVIPAGTICRVAGKRGGFILETDPCVSCGVAVRISRVPPQDVADMGRR